MKDDQLKLLVKLIETVKAAEKNRKPISRSSSRNTQLRT